MTQLWTRVGDCGEYESWGDDLAALLDYLNELHVGQVDHWRPGGLETCNYWSYDYISIYWGDPDGNLIDDLTTAERTIVEAGLEEAYI